MLMINHHLMLRREVLCNYVDEKSPYLLWALEVNVHRISKVSFSADNKALFALRSPLLRMPRTRLQFTTVFVSYCTIALASYR